MHITKDSRQVKPGSIYFCFIGEVADGHDFIDSAINNGASKIIGTKQIDNIDIYQQVKDIDIAFSEYAMKRSDFADTNLKYVGITGTDGKTSTALILDQILNKLSSSSYLGTSGFFIANKEISYTGMTTLFADELYENIKLADKTTDNLVMEVSSHALKQKRVHGLSYDVAIFTNFTSDHLDYHKTLDDYFYSKLLITDYLKPGSYLVVNSEIERLEEIRHKYPNIITFGVDGDAKISEIVTNLNKTTFKLTYQNKTYQITSSLLAQFNTYNLTSAIIAASLLGYEINDIIKVVADIKVDGRLMYQENTDYADVILDFAHTPDAILKVMEFVNSQKANKKICVVTGSAGGRDGLKRPEMGEYAAKYADTLILTEDDPRNENVSDICNDLASGVNNSNCEVLTITDRKQAIKQALEKMDKDDIVILFGKTGQKYMYVGDTHVDYDELDTLNEVIKELQ